MKKIKNPFKMLGSYIGAVAGLISMWFGMDSFSGYILKMIMGNTFYLNSLSSFLFIISYTIPIILGFLLGWEIEVLIRKNKWFGLK